MACSACEMVENTALDVVRKLVENSGCLSRPRGPHNVRSSIGQQPVNYQVNRGTVLKKTFCNRFDFSIAALSAIVLFHFDPVSPSRARALARA